MSCSRSTRSTSSTMSETRLSPTSRPTIANSPEPLGFRSLFAAPDLGALRRQCLVAQRAHALVLRAASAASHLERDRGRGGSPQRALPSAGAMDQPAASRFPRLRRHDPERTGGARRAGSSSPIRAVQSTVASHSGRRPRGRGGRGGRRGHADARRRDRHRARRRAVESGRAGPRSPTSSRRTSSG